jgi:hypothetical protein
VLSYNLPTICAIDPPPMPNITAADVSAVFNPFFNVTQNDVSTQKFRDLLTILIWASFCQCNSAPQPPAPVAPAPPSGIPTLTPAFSGLSAVLGMTPQNTKAFHGAPPANWFLPGFNDTAWTGVDARPGDNFADGSEYYNATTIHGEQQLILPAPARSVSASAVAGLNPDSINLRWTFDLTSVPTVEPYIGLYCAWPAGFSGAPGSAWINGKVQGVIFNPNNWLGRYKDLVVGRNVIALSIAMNCNGAPPGGGLFFRWQGQGTQQVPTDCCLQTQQQLNMVLSGVQAAMRQINILQRALVPFADILGTAHAGLTGSGSFAVQGLLGVKIELTTLPASYRQDASTPPYIRSAGWVSMSDPNGFIDETRVHANPQNWLSRIASEATTVGYSFSPGIVATITELKREA